MTERDRLSSVCYRRTGVRAVALGSVILLTLAGCQAPGRDETGQPSTIAPTTAAASSPVPGPRLVWTACGEAECATLTVPRDYHDPSAGSFELALARRRAERPDLRIGVLLSARVGPGVPGTPGLILGSDRFSVDLRARFDIVSWDPRGASGDVVIDCVDDPDYFRGLDPTPDTLQEIALLSERARDFVAGCEQRSGDVLPYVSTLASARDLDRLRIALGEDQVSYLGVRYGAALGAAYAALFPERVRAMVLDSGFDPSAEPDALIAQGAAGRARVLGTILDACARDALCYFHNGGEATAAFTALMTRLEVTPLLVGTALPVVDQGEAWRAVLFALPDQPRWTRLTMALGEAQAGDGMELLLLSEESIHRSPTDADAGVAIGCADWVGRGSAAGRPADELAEVAARLGTAAAGFICEHWPVDPQPIPPVGVDLETPILVAGVTGDAVAPLEASRTLADGLPGGVLLEVEGNRHGAYQPGREDRACAVAVIDWYLISLTLPIDGAICGPEDGLPRPPV
jgi:pimeloyl-ACP methyl ester carboxylesterase